MVPLGAASGCLIFYFFNAKILTLWLGRNQAAFIRKSSINRLFCYRIKQIYQGTLKHYTSRNRLCENDALDEKSACCSKDGLSCEEGLST